MIQHIQTEASPIGEGDAGVVLKKDGTFALFNTHENFDPANMTERQIEQATILTAFKTALRHPSVMQVLIEVSNDPRIAGEIDDMGQPKNG